jgi:outer membrane protein insertion porin family
VTAFGNLRVPTDRIVAQAGIRPGMPLDRDAVSEGLVRLFRTGQFADIRVESEPAEGGVRILIRVQENPLVEAVEFEGEDELDEDDLKPQAGLAAGDIFSESALRRSVRKITDAYKEKGYLLAKVTPTVKRGEAPNEGRATVTFDIDEGKKVSVKSIEITGLRHVKPDDAQGAMKTKEDRWWRGGDFKRDLYNEDLDRIAGYLKDRGYADARIVSDSVWADPNGRDIYIRVEAEEGPFYRWGDVAVRGSEIMKERKLLDAIHLEPGKPFSEADFQKGLENVYSLFAEEGHIYTNIVPERTKRDSLVDLTFFVTDGPPAHVGKIFITGNTKTKERIIRRELTVYPGDLFRRSALMRSQREIFQLGFFGDVKIDHEPVRGTNDIHLTFEVEEKQTGQASMGAGFSSQNGATGFIRLGETNLFGNAQRFDVLWEFGNLTQVEVSFTEPWLFGTPTTAGVDVTAVRRNLDTYYDIRRGGGVRLGRPIPWLDYSRIDWSYRLERRELEARQGASPSVIAAQGLDLISSMRVALFRSSTDRPFHPTTGSTTILSAELAGGPLGGDIQYHQEEVESRYYFPSFWRLVLGLRGRVGVIDGLHSPSSVPVYERYRLGGTGPHGLRGYGDRDVVPEGNDVDVGGRTMLVLSAEYKFPVVESVHVLFFADAGDTWNSFHEVRLGELRRGAGFGVRFEVPMLGQLGFDLGYGYDRTDALGLRDPGWEPHFQLGSLF